MSVPTPALANRAETSRASMMNPRPNPPALVPERLMYTGQSIFFGGPLLNAARDGRRSEASAASRPEVERDPTAARGGEGRGDSFPVFVPGGFQKN